jgi:hypothetical protein
MADIPDANTVGRTTLFMSSSVIPIGSMRYGRRTGLRIRLNPYLTELRSVLDRRRAAMTGRWRPYSSRRVSARIKQRSRLERSWRRSRPQTGNLPIAGKTTNPVTQEIVTQ